MIAVTLIGVVIMVAGVWSMVSNRKFMKKAVETTGNIQEVLAEKKTETDEDGYTSTYTSYTPLIKFDVQEKEFTFKASISSRNKRKFNVGDSMTVYYDPEDPTKAKAKSVMGNTIMPIILIIVGLLMVIGGLVGDFS